MRHKTQPQPYDDSPESSPQKRPIRENRPTAAKKADSGESTHCRQKGRFGRIGPRLWLFE